MAEISKIQRSVGYLFAGAVVLVVAICADAIWGGRDRAEGLAQAGQDLQPALAALGLKMGAPAFIRIFKQSRELEVWLWRKTDSRWLLFRTYPICNYSGNLGPKLQEGDRQSPEGLYRVGLDQLHPTSRFHLAFNLGFPNEFDRTNGRTGSYLMVHGDCLSVGCYAMTDRGIEQIFALVEAALNQGQEAFQVQAFPARLDSAWLASQQRSSWIGFWRNLKSCYDIFEDTKRPPTVRVEGKRYHCT